MLLTVFQCPDFFFWIFTGTVSAHAANPSLTVTLPRATRASRSRREMLRSCDWLGTAKSVALVAVPPGVVTVILPVVAPAGTVVTIWFAVFDVMVAVVPLNFTEVAPVKFVPVMVTWVPTGPELGVNKVIVGTEAVPTVKFVALSAVPLAVVTLMGPVVAPAGTVVTICVALFDVIVAVVPLNFTEVAPVRFVPMMVTGVPTGPEVGVNDVMVGLAQLPATVKAVALVPTPLTFVTEIFPFTAPAGTAARSWVLESKITVVWSTGVVSAPKVALVTSGLVKPVPVIVTMHPTGPPLGVNDVIVGVAASAGAASPNTSSATPTNTPAKRGPMFRFELIRTLAFRG